jgi:hypothetical protein
MDEEEKISKIADRISLLGNKRNRIGAVYFSGEKEVTHLLSLNDIRESQIGLNKDRIVSNFEFIQYIFERAKIEHKYEKKIKKEIDDFENFINNLIKKIEDELKMFKNNIIQEFKENLLVNFNSNKFIRDYEKGNYSNDEIFQKEINNYISDVLSKSIYDLKEYENYILNNTFLIDRINEISNYQKLIIETLKHACKYESVSNSKIDSLRRNIEEISSISKEKWEFYKETAIEYLINFPIFYVSSLEKIEKHLQNDLIKKKDKEQKELKIRVTIESIEKKIEENIKYSEIKYKNYIEYSKYLKPVLQDFPEKNMEILVGIREKLKEKIVFQSKILNHKRDDTFILNLLQSILQNRKFSYELIFSSLSESFSLKNCCEKMDYQGPTLILCETKCGKRFGGYFESKIIMNSKISDNNMILFSITGQKDFKPPSKNCVIFCSEDTIRLGNNQPSISTYELLISEKKLVFNPRYKNVNIDKRAENYEKDKDNDQGKIIEEINLEEEEISLNKFVIPNDGEKKTLEQKSRRISFETEYFEIIRVII